MTLTLGLLIAILAVVITGFFSLVALIVNQVGRLGTKIEALRTELKGDTAGLRIERKLDEHLRWHDAVAS